MSRIRSAVETWKARDITSPRMLVTAVGILALVVPVNLYVVVTGPTAGDRLGALAFAVVSAALGLYSLWEAKAPRGRFDRERRRSDEDDGRP